MGIQHETMVFRGPILLHSKCTSDNSSSSSKDPRLVSYTDLTFWKKSTYEQLINRSNSSLLDIVDSTTTDEEEQNNNSQQFDNNESFIDAVDSVDLLVDDTSSPVVKKPLTNKRKRSMGVNQFIMSQAEDAFDYEECFIDDDDDKAIQEEEEDDDGFIVDDNSDEEPRENYLQSVAHLVGVPQHKKFKLKYDFDPNINVYSQAVVEDDDDDNEYEEDSFCCDEIVYDNQPTQLPAMPNTPSMKLRNSKKISRSKVKQESTPKPNSEMLRKKRFRRVHIDSP